MKIYRTVNPIAYENTYYLEMTTPSFLSIQERLGDHSKTN